MFYTGDSGPRRVSNVNQAALDKQSGVAIYLEKNSYDAGDVIRGHVEVDIKKDLKVKGMKIHFSGAARVSLDSEKTTHYKGVSIDTNKCKNFEPILDHKIHLLKKDPNQLSPDGPAGRKKSIFACAPMLDESESYVISAGVNKYPFEFALPRTLPSSYDGRWGSIQYGVRLTIEKFNDIERLTPFGVRGIVDLNDDLDLLKPVSTSSSFSYSRFCSCTKKKVTVHLSMMKRAYLPGEPVRFIADIINESHKELKNIKTALVQLILFRTGTQTKKSTTMLQVIQSGTIGPKQSKRCYQEIMTVPQDVAPTSFCKSIQIKYLLNVNIHIGLMDDDLNIPLPLIVGTVPFKPAAAQRHLAILRQNDPVSQSLLAQFENQELLTVSRQNSMHSNLMVPREEGANGRRYSTGSAQDLSGNASPVKRMSSTAQSLTVSEARRVRLSNSNLTED